MAHTTLIKGTPVTLAGVPVRTGEPAPDFTLVDAELKPFRLADGGGKRLLLNIFPSIDTPTCARSVRTFNQLASEMPRTLVLCISRDLPFAQSRFCGAEGLQNVRTLSAFRPQCRFGEDYGVLITDGPLEGLFARAVVMIDENGIIRYTQLVDDIAEDPDYDRALQELAR